MAEAFEVRVVVLSAVALALDVVDVSCRRATYDAVGIALDVVGSDSRPTATIPTLYAVGPVVYRRPIVQDAAPALDRPGWTIGHRTGATWLDCHLPP